MSERIVFRAFVQSPGHPETCGGTSIYVEIPEGLTDQQKIFYIAGQVGGETARYLASECLTALSYKRG